MYQIFKSQIMSQSNIHIILRNRIWSKAGSSKNVSWTINICCWKLPVQKIQWWSQLVVDCFTSAVSCRWASLAAPKCWVSSSFSTAYYKQARQNRYEKHGIQCVQCTQILIRQIPITNVTYSSHTNSRYLTLLGGVFHTSLAFFWRSTIWERRCVISSCCLEASSLFLASSSAREEICRLELPGCINRWSLKHENLQKNGTSAAPLPLESEKVVDVVDKYWAWHDSSQTNTHVVLWHSHWQAAALSPHMR